MNKNDHLAIVAAILAAGALPSKEKCSNTDAVDMYKNISRLLKEQIATIPNAYPFET
jgi:hypothetical protein